MGQLRPLEIEAALAAMEADKEQLSDKRQQSDNAIQQAQYEAARARRQYDAVDPDNRLFMANWSGAGMRNWFSCATWRFNATASIKRSRRRRSRAEDRARLMALGKDLTKAWNSPGASIETRKKIIRLLVKEIIVDVVDDKLALVIHWQGGGPTELTVKKNKIGHTRWTVKTEVVDLVRVLARQLPDMAIAAILNRSGKLTGHGATWTRTHVRGLRNANGIATYREGERAERGEVMLDEAADILKVSRATAYRMVVTGVLPAQQPCAGAPWIIRLADLQQDAVHRDAEARRSRRPDLKIRCKILLFYKDILG